MAAQPRRLRVRLNPIAELASLICVLFLATAVSASAQSSGWSPDPSVSRSVFVRSAGDLVLYSQTGQGNWQSQNLSISTGFHLTGTPSPIGGYQFDPWRRQFFWRGDVFARSTAGALIHFWWTPWDNWQHEDLTHELGGPLFAADPVPVLAYQQEWQRETIRHDVFGRNSADQLVHYWWNVQLGWHAENLTTMTNGQTVAGDTINVLVSRQKGYLRYDVFARNSASQLIHYWWSAEPPSGWHAENLTQMTAGPIFTGAPTAVVSYQNGYLLHHVYARNTASELIHYWWSEEPPSGWHAENLTKFTGRPTVLGKIEVTVAEQNGYLRHDVFARNGYNQLIHYWWSGEPPSGWHGENLTGPGGAPVANDPVAVTAEQTGYLRYDVFARGTANELDHYWWSAEPPSGWHNESLTRYTSGPTLTGIPDVYVTGSTIKHEVFGRNVTNGTGHLVRYWWTAPSSWHAEDLTALTTGPVLSGDPVVMTFPAERAPLHIRNWSQFDVNQVWLVSGGGPGTPLVQRLLTPDLSPLLPAGIDYNNEIVAQIPVFRYPAASSTVPYYALQHIQEQVRFAGVPQYFPDPRWTTGFAPGVIDVPGYSLVRETMFIFDWDGFPTSRFEQMLRGPDGRLYLYRPGDQFFGHPEVESGPILLQTLIDEGYGAYAPWQRVP